MNPEQGEDRLLLRLRWISLTVILAMIVLVVAAAVWGQDHRVDATFLAVLVGAALVLVGVTVPFNWPWSK